MVSAAVRTQITTCILTPVVCILVVMALLVSGRGNAQAASAIQRHISYSYTLQNESGGAIKNAQFWTYAPVKQTPTQKCTKITCSYPYKPRPWRCPGYSWKKLGDVVRGI